MQEYSQLQEKRTLDRCEIATTLSGGGMVARLPPSFFAIVVKGIY